MFDNDADLIRKAGSGDLFAFKEFIRLYSPRVHAIAYQMVGNSIDAQDIAQEVFLSLYKSLHSYKPQFRFTTWLYRLTVNRSIDHLRKRTRQNSTPLDFVQDEAVLEDRAQSPVRSLELNELKGTIERISKDLTQNQRKIFVLRDLQEFTTEEVAQILKCRVSTVRVHLSKARKRIKEALENEDLAMHATRTNQEDNENEMQKN